MEFVIRCIDGKTHPIDQVAPLIEEARQTRGVGDDASGEADVLGRSEQVAQVRAERWLATDEGDLVSSSFSQHLGDGDAISLGRRSARGMSSKRAKQNLQP